MRNYIFPLALYFSIFLPCSAYSTALGLDVISESHHVYGWAGDHSTDGVYVSYDITSEEALHYRVDGVYFFDPEYEPALAESWAGDFSVKTHTGRWTSDAWAESTYTFRPEHQVLIFDVTARDNSTHQSPTIRYSLTDLNSGEQLLYNIYDRNNHEDWLQDIPYTLSNHKQFILSVDPASTYELQMYVYGWGGDSSALTSLDVDIASRAVPVPEPSTMLLFGTSLVGVFSTKIRRKKYSVTRDKSH